MRLFLIGTMALLSALRLSGCGWLDEEEITSEELEPTRSVEVSTIGRSMSDAVIVPSQSHLSGISWEYAWLGESACLENGGVAFRQGQELLSDDKGKRYDLIAVECNDGELLEYYFDIDNFFGNY